ncbi:amidohydrolase family protein [Streptomyces sp. AM6-12]|uniref:amidohydrolase family protein n=1 Tax=Streptomyces sp. AM6-12 TaxID=3345149 RepID=UPI0037AAC381
MIELSARRIDVHAHYFGGSVAALARTHGLPPAIAARPWTPEDALAAMDRHEVATQVLSVPFTATSEGQRAGFARTLCRRINEELAGLIDQYPGRFRAFACLPGDGPEAMLDELAYALDVLRLDGVSLTSNVAGRYLGAPVLDSVLAELDRRRAPVYIHPAACAHAAELSLGRHASLLEFPFDTARTITDALYCGVFLRHRGLRLILSHLGGALPALAWRIAACTTVSAGPGDALVTAEHVAEVLRGLYYDTAMAGSPHSLLPVLQVTGIDHILFGTDVGAAPEPIIAGAIGELTCALSGPDLEAVECSNAARLFPRLA